MQRMSYLAAFTGVILVFASPADVQAQRGSTRGAVAGGIAGAAIGGLADGGRGAAAGALIGMGVGSVMGRAEDRRRNNHYWIDGRCWRRSSNGEFHPVASRSCR